MYKHYSHNDHSIDLVLDSFSSDIFDGIILAMRPIVGGIDYLKRMHKTVLLQKQLNKMSRWDDETREKLMDIMTDLVSFQTNDKKFKAELENKISELDEISETFTQLNHIFESIDGRQILQILKISLAKLDGKITSIRNELNSNMWDENNDINQLLVVDQMFYLIKEIIHSALLEPKPDSKSFTLITHSLLYIEAFHRNKVTFEDIKNQLSELNLSVHKMKSFTHTNDTIFEVLTV